MAGNTMPDKKKVLKGRKAIDAYREVHARLYSKGWQKGLSEDHTPLLNKLLAKLKKLGFNSLDGFFAASEELNIQELGSSSEEGWR